MLDVAVDTGVIELLKVLLEFFWVVIGRAEFLLPGIVVLQLIQLQRSILPLLVSLCLMG